MNEDILNKTVIYINTDNVTYYKSDVYDFYYDLLEPIKDAVYVKLMRSEVILNPKGTINGQAILDSDPIFVDLRDYNRISTNLGGRNIKCTDVILLNISEKFGPNDAPNKEIAFKSDYTSMSCNPNDTNMIVLNPIEPNFKRFNIQLYDKTGTIISKNSLSKFTMIVCVYHKRRKVTQF